MLNCAIAAHRYGRGTSHGSKCGVPGAVNPIFVSRACLAAVPQTPAGSNSQSCPRKSPRQTRPRRRTPKTRRSRSKLDSGLCIGVCSVSSFIFIYIKFKTHCVGWFSSPTGTQHACGRGDHGRAQPTLLQVAQYYYNRITHRRIEGPHNGPPPAAGGSLCPVAHGAYVRAHSD